MIAPARVAAYEALLAVSGGRADLPSAIARARASLSDERDRALATDIATGVQRWRAALDHLIVHFARRTLDRLDPEIVDILRLGIYQLLHLTRVPAAAVVDDAVSLAKRARKKSASGLVNAVLRAVSRGRQRLPLPAPPDKGEGQKDAGNREQALDYLSITLSHPRWLAERWLDRLGFDTAEAWMRFNNTAPPLTLRTNVLRTTTAFRSVSAIAWWRPRGDALRRTPSSWSTATR
jgi:16S rRNA (cytosine967-C5)-methyltransferase